VFLPMHSHINPSINRGAVLVFLPMDLGAHFQMLANGYPPCSRSGSKNNHCTFGVRLFFLSVCLFLLLSLTLSLLSPGRSLISFRYFVILRVLLLLPSLTPSLFNETAFRALSSKQFLLFPSFGLCALLFLDLFAEDIWKSGAKFL